MARADMCLGRRESDDHPVGPLALLSLSATSAINSRSPAVSSPTCSEDEPEALGGRGECAARRLSSPLVAGYAPRASSSSRRSRLQRVRTRTPKIGRVPTLLLGVGRNLGGW